MTVPGSRSVSEPRFSNGGTEMLSDPPVAIICALDFEFRTVTRMLRHPNWSGPFAKVGSPPGDILLRQSGVGQARARAAARDALRDGATALVAWGVAGSLDSSCPPGTVLLPAIVRRPGGTSFRASEGWRKRLAGKLAPHVAVQGGELLSVDEVLATPQAKAGARKLGAVAVDMESAAVAEIAATARRPFIALRVIFDGAGDHLPDAPDLVDPAGRLDLAAALRVLCRPRQWAPLWVATRRYHTARTVLGRCASTLAEAGLGCPERTDPATETAVSTPQRSDSLADDGAAP